MQTGSTSNLEWLEVAPTIPHTRDIEPITISGTSDMGLENVMIEVNIECDVPLYKHGSMTRHVHEKQSFLNRVSEITGSAG